MDPVQNLKSREGTKNRRNEPHTKDRKNQEHEESAHRSMPLETKYRESVYNTHQKAQYTYPSKKYFYENLLLKNP